MGFRTEAANILLNSLKDIYDLKEENKTYTNTNTNTSKPKIASIETMKGWNL